MKMILPISTLILGLIGGYFLKPESTALSESTENTTVSAKSSRKGFDSSAESLSAKTRKTNTAGNSRSTSKNPIIEKFQSMFEFYTELDRQELETEALKLEGMPFSERMVAAPLLFARWGEIAPFEALEFSDKIGFAGRFVRPTILQSWSADDPKGAAKYFTSNPQQFRNQGRRWGRTGNNSPAGAIAGEWAKRDFDSALSWSKTLSGNDASSATVAIFREAAKENPKQASKQLALIDDEKLRENAATSIATEWAKLDPSQAESWAINLEQPDKSASLAKIFATLSQKDAFAAAEKINLIEDQGHKSDVIETIANNMSKLNPAEAMNWISNVDTELVKPHMARRPMSTLTATNDQAARTWLNEQHSGPLRDSAAMTYIFTTRNSDPLQSLEIAASIENDNQAERAENLSLSRWLNNDPDAAEAYMKENGFDENRINRIQRWSKRG